MAPKYEELTPENQVKYRAKAGTAWDRLVNCAARRETDSYESFGRKIEVGKYQVGMYVLYLIREYCTANNIPLLNCLVIRADGKPGERWTRGRNDNFRQNLEEVFDFDWSEIENPFCDLIDKNGVRSGARAI
jgi:putative restriction endonuclease